MESSLFSPTYIKELCQHYGFRPSKQYGQNYLISRRVPEIMLEAGGVTKEDTVVEIGPGFGVLTFALVEAAKKVIAFEIEKRLIPYWEREQKKYPTLEMVWGNALYKISERVENIGPYKVVANLPYQITSEAIRALLELPHPPECIVMMVQKEVAQRLVATPGEMSLLSVAVQAYSEVKIVHKVLAGSFWPVPQVDSAVIRLSHIRAPQNAKAFFTVVRAGFSHKRKQLAKNLEAQFHIGEPLIRTILQEEVGNEKVRAEEVSVEEWSKVSTRVHSITTCKEKIDY